MGGEEVEMEEEDAVWFSTKLLAETRGWVGAQEG